MNYTIKVKDGDIAIFWSTLEKLQRRSNDELRPMCDILFDAMVKEESLSKTTVRWLSSRKQELFPAFIKPFSDRKLIYARAKKISKFIKEINLNSLAYDDDFWAQLHFALNLREGLKPQLNKAQTIAYWFKKLRR